MATPRKSVVAGSITSIVLMVLFYALAIAAAIALAWSGYEAGGWVLHTLHGKGALFAGVGVLALFAASVVVLWSVVPRVDNFEPPGPELTRAQHPALLREVERIAAATGEPMPEHIYLVNDVNAFVAQRGGIVGIGSHRVMGIGLPLLCALDLAELRSVLGHEFGHFCGGDTKMLPWVYKARRAMISTVENLGGAAEGTADWGQFAFVGWIFGAVRWPFKLYAELFLKFTQWLSRAQELAADQVGAKIAGSAASIAALKKVELAAVAYHGYLRGELEPLLQHGRLPPVAEGFNRFLGSAQVTALTSALAEHRAQETEEVDPYDSHPPLAERVAALEAFAAVGFGDAAGRPALELLGDATAAERALMEFVLAEGQKLEPVAWKDSGRVLSEAWKKSAQGLAPALGRVAFEDLPVEVDAHRRMLAKFTGTDGTGHGDEAVKAWARSALLQLVFAALAARGLTIESFPGEPVRFVSGDQRFEPAAKLFGLIDGKTSRDEWREFCLATGLSSFDVTLLAAA